MNAQQIMPSERTNAWDNAFTRLKRCYERREIAIDAFFDLADAIITVRSLIRQGKPGAPCRPRGCIRTGQKTPVITERKQLDDHGTCACLTSRHAQAPRITNPRDL
jgi:hypothetical protein